jgi:hypothetical protein
MTEGKWEVVTTVSGSLQADIIRTLLESQDIKVFLNQEGAGRVYGINVGPLGEVQIMVLESQFEVAQQILDDYYAGKFAADDEDILEDED